jgi:hypothetical protein
MSYTLPGGRLINLEDIVRISKIRDDGEDSSSIEYSKISFKVYLDNQEAIEVFEQYHFADWSDKRRKLAAIRDNLVALVKKTVGDVVDN